LNPALNGCATDVRANAGMRNLLDGFRAARAARIWPEIADPSSAQRAAMPYGIDCDGVTVHDMGEAFADELHGRKRWCRENCTGVFSVEPIRDPGTSRDTGRRFRFSDPTDAAMFRLSWC
jgi:hypothetical protein